MILNTLSHQSVPALKATLIPRCGKAEMACFRHVSSAGNRLNSALDVDIDALVTGRKFSRAEHIHPHSFHVFRADRTCEDRSEIILSQQRRLETLGVIEGGVNVSWMNFAPRIPQFIRPK